MSSAVTKSSLPPVIILWDCDGTLAETESPAMRVAIEQLLEEFGQETLISKFGPGKSREEFIQDRIQNWAGKSFEDMIETCEEGTGITLSSSQRQRRIDICFDKTVEALAQVGPVKGILSTLERVAQKGFLQLVVTSSELQRVIPSLRSSGVAPYFQPVEGGIQPPNNATDRAGRPLPLQELIWSAKGQRVTTKPDPAIYNQAMEAIATHYGVSVEDVRERVIAIEDSGSGVAAAAAAGIKHVLGWLAGSHIEDKLGHSGKLQANGATGLAGTTDNPGYGLQTAIHFAAHQIMRATGQSYTAPFVSLGPGPATS